MQTYANPSSFAKRLLVGHLVTAKAKIANTGCVPTVQDFREAFALLSKCPGCTSEYTLLLAHSSVRNLEDTDKNLQITTESFGDQL